MIETVDLLEIIQNIVTVQREEDLLHIWNIQINEQEKMEVEADQEKMAQLFTNLIYNARKYSPEGGSIEIWMKQKAAKIGGTGLGLAICKEIVEAHNRKIELSSELGKVTIIQVILPTKQSQL